MKKEELIRKFMKQGKIETCYDDDFYDDVIERIKPYGLEIVENFLWKSSKNMIRKALENGIWIRFSFFHCQDDGNFHDWVLIRVENPGAQYNKYEYEFERLASAWIDNFPCIDGFEAHL